MDRELPKIISVDDHVIEPPHVFQEWLPQRFREQGPRGRAPPHRGRDAHGRRGVPAPVGRRRHPRRLLGLRGPHRHRAPAQPGRGGLPARRDGRAGRDLRRDASGLLRPEGPPRRHGRELGRGVAVLPHVPALLRADVHRGEGPRPRARVRARVQRLDGRGVVRRLRRPPDPADHRAAVGRRARRRRDPTQRRARRASRDVLRDPAQPRAALDPLRPLGPVLPRVRRDRRP